MLNQNIAQISDSQKEIENENQYSADLGNGYYKNPVISGDLADPSIIRIEKDYYMIHGKGVHHAFILWHSRDLVNWKPVAKIPHGMKDSPWAPDLAYTKNRFYIYITFPIYPEKGERTFSNFVLYADNILGPWSEPIDLDIQGIIDPGHLTTEDGKRYLFFEMGIATELTDDGLATKGELIHDVYDGWDYPEDWVVGCWCLESPKLFYKDGYYYLISAMGGTGMPPTAHMAVVERSLNPLGPYEDSPYNPLIHTFSKDEKWWSQGHATLIEHIDGTWWSLFHGIENGHTDMGRQTLLLPIEWTEDDWPIVKDKINAGEIIKKPIGENVGDGYVVSDDFIDSHLGIQWSVTNSNIENIKVGNGKLEVLANGDLLSESTQLYIKHVNHSFQITVELEIEDGSEGGILVGNSGVGLKKGNPPFYSVEKYDEKDFPYSPIFYLEGNTNLVRRKELSGWFSNKINLKIINDDNVIIMYYSKDGENWVKYSRSFYSNNLKPHIYAKGKGKVIFKNFKYRGLE